MTRKPSNCVICENSNQASICAPCVNYRLHEYHNLLKSLKSRRDHLYSRLVDMLVAKGKADYQSNWRVIQNEKLARLREILRQKKEQLLQGKAKMESISPDLKLNNGVLESSFSVLEKNCVEQLEKSYPNFICAQNLALMAITSERLRKQSVVVEHICIVFPQSRVVIDGEQKDGFSGQFDQICNARLPRGLDPHSVPSEELAASLGYMVQLLNLVLNLGIPALHNSGFAGSCSCIWQRNSYGDARASSRSSEYPLFIPRQNYCSVSGENPWSDRSSTNFGVASIKCERKARLKSVGNISFNYSSASPLSIEIHRDLQKGISLLKRSVACITAYCYNSPCLDVPPEASTFEAFAKLLAILSSSKDDRSVEPVQQLNKSAWSDNSAISTSLSESVTTYPIMKNRNENNPPSPAPSFLHATELGDAGKNECLIEEWDLVEHPTFSPPPSQTEDVEHWTFIDVQKRFKKHLNYEDYIFKSNNVSSNSMLAEQVQQLNKSAWSDNSAIATSLLESVTTYPIMKNRNENNSPSSASSFLHATELGNDGKNECLIEEWDLVEHPTLPPPPSQTEDVEH